MCCAPIVEGMLWAVCAQHGEGKTSTTSITSCPEALVLHHPGTLQRMVQQAGIQMAESPEHRGHREGHSCLL